MFVTLRIGPYVCAEWDNGGLPVWLGFKEGMQFREVNGPWQTAVQHWRETCALLLYFWTMLSCCAVQYHVTACTSHCV